MSLLVIGLVISVFPVTVSCEPPEVEGWTLTVDEGPIAGNPDLVEYVWTTDRPPYGLYDKIAVHRVLRADGKTGEGVVFLLPGTWSSGEQMIHVRKDGVQYGVPNANRSILLYLATRGFDMYVLDYRTHFVPHTETDLSFMLYWNWDAWMGDIKAAVDLIKTVSGVCKIYIGGSSFGGGAAMNYASMYWEEDLKGVILLDPAYCQVAAKRGNETNSFNLTEATEDLIASGEYSTDSTGGPNNPIWAIALTDPGAELFIWPILMDGLYAAGAANPDSYPYSQPAPMFAVMASADPYWPFMLGLESVAYMDYTNCPYLPYDFDDHYIEIDVPVIGFATKRYWVVLAAAIPEIGEFGEIVYGGIANPDFTGVRLDAGYGHLDVFAGTHNREDVNEPTYQWLFMREGLRLTVASSPITGVTFTIGGTPETTPYTEWLVKGSYTIEMPETRTVGNTRYYWSQWSDGNTSRSRKVTMTANITLTAYFTGPDYQLTVTSLPVTGIIFTINGAPQTTPYTEWLLGGSYTLEMPQTHNGYAWSHWLEDGDTNRTKTVTLPGTTWTAVYTPPPPPEYTLTIYSSPTGVTFTVDSVPHTTPWSGTYNESTSVSLIMPEIHAVGDAKYYWNQWSDGVTNRLRTVTMNANITLTAQYTGPYYQLTVTSSPITGITFTINGATKTTPYTEWLLGGSYTLVMPQTHNGYIFSHWQEDGDTNRIKTILLQGTTWTAVYEPAPKPVGGKATPINMPMNKPETPTLWIWLTTTILSLAVTVVYVKKRKRHTEIFS